MTQGDLTRFSYRVKQQTIPKPLSAVRLKRWHCRALCGTKGDTNPAETKRTRSRSCLPVSLSAGKALPASPDWQLWRELQGTLPGDAWITAAGSNRSTGDTRWLSWTQIYSPLYSGFGTTQNRKPAASAHRLLPGTFLRPWGKGKTLQTE